MTAVPLSRVRRFIIREIDRQTNRERGEGGREREREGGGGGRVGANNLNIKLPLKKTTFDDGSNLSLIIFLMQFNQLASTAHVL